MSLPPLQLQPVSTSHYYISGDVTIQSGAAIAPGVLIQADADSRIIIKTGACIGIGSILHACRGTLEVGEGANIGAEVLLIGEVKIGANACIGSATTILNSTVELGQVVPPGSLIGDNTRQPGDLQATDTVIYPAPADTNDEAGLPPVVPTEIAPPPKTVDSAGVNVYGQVYVNKLLVKMFPNSQRASASSSPSSADPWDD